MAIDFYVNEESTLKLSLTFTDEAGLPVTPSTIKWTLTNSDGQVINNRTNVEIAPAGSVEDLMLFGDDLLILDTEKRKTLVKRFFTVNVTYQDGGSTYPLHEVTTFKIRNSLTIT